MCRPVLSIVVPSYNSERYIGACLQSLKEQFSDEVEIILIDGGSTDGTMLIVEEYRDMLSVVISGPDAGQSDAFNKGFALGKGKYFTWLNSDDIFCPGALTRLVDEIKRGESLWYAANVVYIDSDSKVIRCCQSGPFEAFSLRFGVLNVFGPSTIFHRDLYERLGGFRKDFHYCMDTEYWWRIAMSGVRYKRLPIYLWALRLHDEAKTAASVTGGEKAKPPGMKKENERNRKMYFSHVSARRKRVGIMLARAYRILTLSYVKSYLSTLRYKGKVLGALGGVR